MRWWYRMWNDRESCRQIGRKQHSLPITKFNICTIQRIHAKHILLVCSPIAHRFHTENICVPFCENPISKHRRTTSTHVQCSQPNVALLLSNMTAIYLYKYLFFNLSFFLALFVSVVHWLWLICFCACANRTFVRRAVIRHLACVLSLCMVIHVHFRNILCGTWLKWWSNPNLCRQIKFYTNCP